MKKCPNKIKVVVAVLLAVAALFFTGCALNNQKESTASFTAMDTLINLKIKGDNSQEIIDKIKAFVVDYDYNTISRHSELSEVSTINNNGKCPVDSQLYPIINKLTSVWRSSDGAFDFTLGALSDLWGFGTDSQKVPTQTEIDEILSKCGVEKLQFDSQGVNIPKGAIIDFGAAGKGMALDIIKEYLAEDKTITRAVISLGGSILLYGNDIFTVGITNPKNTSGYMAKLKLDACCVSTSGNYERYFEQGGVRYHHILNPATGYPVQNELVSVTVVSNDGTLSDVLSTACFVLGIEKSIPLLKEYDCEGVFIDKAGNVTVTEGLNDKIEITDNSYTIK